MAKSSKYPSGYEVELILTEEEADRLLDLLENSEEQHHEDFKKEIIQALRGEI